MYCSKCGSDQSDKLKSCSNCGSKFSKESNTFHEINNSINSSNELNSHSNLNLSLSNVKDNPSKLANIASLCFPVIGVVLYFLWRDDKPKSAKGVGNWMIGGIIVYVLVYLLSFAAAFNFGYVESSLYAN